MSLLARLTEITLKASIEDTEAQKGDASRTPRMSAASAGRDSELYGPSDNCLLERG